MLTLLEREKTQCVQSPPEGGKTPCVQSPLGGVKTLCVQSPPEGEKTLCVQSQDISNQVQFQNVHIQEKVKKLPGGRLRQFLPEWEKQGSHQLIIGLIKDGYKLPFRERPKLSAVMQALTSKMPCGPLFQTCCGKVQLKLCTPQTVWGSTAVSSWYQNQATAGGQS